MFNSPDGTMYRFHNNKSISHPILILNREETIDEYLDNIKVNLLDKQKTIESLRKKIDDFGEAFQLLRAKIKLLMIGKRNMTQRLMEIRTGIMAVLVVDIHICFIQQV